MSHAHPASEDTEALHIVTVRVNGVARTASVPARRLLSDFARDLGLTGTHVGCEHGVCGACTVLSTGADAFVPDVRDFRDAARDYDG